MLKIVLFFLYISLITFNLYISKADCLTSIRVFKLRHAEKLAVLCCFCCSALKSLAGAGQITSLLFGSCRKSVTTRSESVFSNARNSTFGLMAILMRTSAGSQNVVVLTAGWHPVVVALLAMSQPTRTHSEAVRR